MSVQLQIVPLSTTLNMYGEPDASSAYSLCGHISLTLRPSSFLFAPRRTSTTMLLKSLELTFEGQSEVVAPAIGYSALRLCSITQELAPPQGLELAVDEEEGRWNILFNMNIPGWLPASSRPGSDITGTSYALYATAKFVALDKPQHSLLSMICSSFRSAQRSIETRQIIAIQRYVEPLATEAVASTPLSHYMIAYKPSDSDSQQHPSISGDVMNKLRMSVSAPSIIDIKSHKIPVTLRLRTAGLSEADCKRLRVTELAVEVSQTDQCRNRPSQQYSTSFPIPGESSQPPSLPLRDHDQFGILFDSTPSIASQDVCIERSLSLLPSYEPGSFALDSDTQNFYPDETSWFTLETDIPISHRGQRGSDWTWSPKLRPSGHGPLFSVIHDLKISFTFVYRFDDDQRTAATHIVAVSVPLHFGNYAPPVAASIDSASPHSTATTSNGGPRLPSPLPYAESLPVYSQLFYSNGERKLDPTPLPLYALNDPETTTFTKEYPVEPEEGNSEAASLLGNS